MNIPHDKLLHLAAGAAAAFLGLLLTVVLLYAAGLPLQAAFPAPFLAALIAGATKERADWMDNKVQPGMHGVEVWDIVATAAPGAGLSLLWFLLI